jgi:hypothetical protein
LTVIVQEDFEIISEMIDASGSEKCGVEKSNASKKGKAGEFRSKVPVFRRSRTAVVHAPSLLSQVFTTVQMLDLGVSFVYLEDYGRHL